MKKQTLLAFITTATLLTACGGSDGNSSPITNTQSTISSDSNSSTPKTPVGGETANGDNSSPTTPSAPSSSTPETPVGGETNGYKIQPIKKTLSLPLTTMQVDHVNSITIDGKTFALEASRAGAINSNGIFGSNYDGKHSFIHNALFNINGASNLSYTRFGWVESKQGEEYGFAQGTTTKVENIPQSGTATYKGSAIWVGINTNVENTNAIFDIDFDKRSLSGTVQGIDHTAPTFTMNADITGNTFASKANAETQVKGGFFGPNAEELGGVFSNERKIFMGSFGAKRQ